MFSSRMKLLRRESGLSQHALAQALKITQQAVSKWEAGLSFPDPMQLTKLAGLFGVSADFLFGLSDTKAPPFEASSPASYVPVIGAVKAGYDALALEERLGVEIADVKDASAYCYLKIKGDSMEPYIHDGDLALVRLQQTLENGNLGVFIYGDGEGTVKRYKKAGQSVTLEPFNERYEPVTLSGSELQGLHIFGRVVETKTRW